MIGAIFQEQLKQSWRQMLYYGIGLAFLAFYMFAMNLDNSLAESYGELLGQMPPAMLNALGVGDMIEGILTPESFIAFGALLYGNIIMVIFAVAAGLNIIASEENSGSIDVLLALPIPRWQVIIEKYLAYSLLIIGVALIQYTGFLAGRMVTPVEVMVDMNKLLLGVINEIPAGLSVMAITIFVTSIFAQKAISTGVASGFMLISYVMYIVGNLVTEDSAGKIIGNLSIWTYFDSQMVMREGLQAANVGLLLGLAVVFLALSVFAFERRDVGA
jgi:beta-exotoxin I transport system permease protein